MNKILVRIIRRGIFIVFLGLFFMAGCNKCTNNSGNDNIGNNVSDSENPRGDLQNEFGDKLNIVTTIYAPYDFIKQIAGNEAELTMLLNPGEESHSFDPSPQDIIKINNCDLFIYNGGENDEWIDDILESMDGNVRTYKMMDSIETLYEEDGIWEEAAENDGAADTHAHAHNHEFDEHVWTSPVNAIKIVQDITGILCVLDEKRKEIYNERCGIYTDKLYELDKEFRDIIKAADKKTITFADRFAMRYFTEEYGLSYNAAFPGCAADNEVNPATLVKLIDIINEESEAVYEYGKNVTKPTPVILKSELSNGNIADAISEETGAEVYTFYSCHNVSKEDFDRQFGYLDMMKANAEVLKEALK